MVAHINAHGLGTRAKLEQILNAMKRLDIGLCLVTEIWHSVPVSEDMDFLYLRTKQDDIRSEGVMLIGYKNSVGSSNRFTQSAGARGNY